MDVSDATKILLDRIQKLEPPEMAMKIIGCILLKDNGEREMIRLACAPEKILESFVYKTKPQAEFYSKPPVAPAMSPPIAINPSPVSEINLSYLPFTPNGSRTYWCPPTYRGPTYWDVQPTSDQQSNRSSDFASVSYGGSFGEDYRLQSQAQYVGFEDQLDPINAGAGNFAMDSYYQGVALSNSNVRASRRSLSLPEFPFKACHYYNKGFCKHGSSCRYLHGCDNYPTIFSPNEHGSEDQLFSPGSLEKLELEITELLKFKRGGPVSIASLPMLYYEKYGKNLQAEGYLTESQRHGRAGYSLTKLLARLKNIRLIDKPHGQHSVILAEDASKYNLENRMERNDPGPIVSGSHQIYFTFPPESTFTEEDVSNYFSTFGSVEDVRIPCQSQRMYGFVTFASANTARMVLNKGNPHFVCGSRVLVKPYREKPKHERKYMEKHDHGMYYLANYSDLEPDFQPLPRCDPPRVLRRQREEQEAQAMEMTRRFSELQLRRTHVHNQQCIDYAAEEQCAPEGSEGLSHLFGLINKNSISDDRSQHAGTAFIDQESNNQGIDLPESPFASAMGSGISAVI